MQNIEVALMTCRHGGVSCTPTNIKYLLFFAEVAHRMKSSFIACAQHIKQKRIHVPVQRFVVQKQLRKVAQILAVHLLHRAVQFKHGHFAVPINLIARRVAG